MKHGWLINDCLTCIPGTKTLWHDLLENIPTLQDKCGGYTAFTSLPNHIRMCVEKEGSPDYIIRNCSYFPPLATTSYTISLLQDYRPKDVTQKKVAETSDMVIFNSPFTKEVYKNIIRPKSQQVIPLGIDFDVFHIKKPKERLDLQKKYNIPPQTLLWVGSHHAIKGFNVLMDIINRSKHNFCCVFKDHDLQPSHPRVRSFVKLTSVQLCEVMNCCDAAICTSVEETQHLAGLEAGACGLPITTTNVGMYYNLPDGVWGRPLKTYQDLTDILKTDSRNAVRSYWKPIVEKSICIDKWKALVESII